MEHNTVLLLGGKRTKSESDEHENRCNQCGECCKLDITLGPHSVPFKCAHQMDNNTCGVYDNRPGWCLSPEQMKRTGTMPECCGYQEEVM